MNIIIEKIKDITEIMSIISPNKAGFLRDEPGTLCLYIRKKNIVNRILVIIFNMYIGKTNLLFQEKDDILQIQYNHPQEMKILHKKLIIQLLQ